MEACLLKHICNSFNEIIEYDILTYDNERLLLAYWVLREELAEFLITVKVYKLDAFIEACYVEEWGMCKSFSEE